MIAAAKVDPDNALAPFVGVAEFYERFTEKAQVAGRDGRLMEVRFDGSRTREALSGSGIVCPPLDEALLRRYLDWFLRVGFYPPPPGRPAPAPPAGAFATIPAG